MRRNNLDQAARLILNAPGPIRADKTIAGDADRVLAASKQRASAALAQSQKNPAAFASDEFRAAETRRLQAASLERRGQIPEAAREYLTAADGFARALTVKPAPAVEAREVNSAPITPAPTTTTAKPPPPVTNPTAAEPPPPPAPSPAPPATRAPVDTTAADTAAIRETLAQFVAGYQRLDAAAIRRVYPSAPATLTFADVRSYSLTLDPPQISISGDRATVRTVRRLRVQMRAGSPQQQTLPTEFSLRREGNGWIVEAIK
jgi:ketosteroid isomerase-like protein